MQPRTWAASGAVLAFLVAPFAAMADAPFSPGGVEGAPPFWVAFYETFEPAFTFASPRVVLDAWQLATAAALTLVLAGAWMWLRASVTFGRARPVAWTAWGMLAVHTLGIVIESLSFREGLFESVGFALYFPTTFVAPLAACVAGFAALRSRALNRSSAWALAAAPLFLVAAMVLFNQFPGGTAPGLAAPWALALHLAHRAHTPKASPAIADA